MESLIQELNSINEGSIFKRTPKKATMPRSLVKLMEHPDLHTNPKYMASVNKKLDAIKDVNDKSKVTDYEYPLTLCAKCNLLEQVKYLIDRGAQLNVEYSCPSLSWAVRNNNLEMCELLIDRGAKLFWEYTIGLEVPPRDVVLNPFLFDASSSGSIEIIELFLKHGANITQKNLNGESLIFDAVEGANVETLQYLIESGLSINERKSDRFKTPLHRATSENKYEICRVLLENGAEVNALEIWGGAGFRREQSCMSFIKDNEEIKKLYLQYGGEIINRSLPDEKYNDLRIVDATEKQRFEYAELRAKAMRPSLERLGRFDENRVRARFLDGFVEKETFKILFNGELSGFYVIRESEGNLNLAHLYIDPDYQNKKIGAFAINKIKKVASSLNKSITLGALKQSRSNDFYQNHGFVFTHEDEFDNYYIWHDQSPETSN